MRRLAVVGVLVGLVLAGCGGDGTAAEPDATSTREPPPSADRRATERPKDDDPSEQDGTGEEVDGTPTAESDSGGQDLTLHQYLMFNAPRYAAIDPGVCTAYDLAYTDRACGEQLVEMVKVGRIVLAHVDESGELDKARRKQLTETADVLRRSVRLVREMGCYGLGEPPAPDSDEAELCGTFARFAGVQWLSFETILDTR